MDGPVPVGAPAALVLAAAALLAPPAAAHANHVEADAQVATGGTVRVEGVLRLSAGWLVLHEVNASGGFGAVLGAVKADPDAGYVTDVPVDADASAANATLEGGVAAVLHDEGGGDGFDRGDDPVVRAFGDPVASRFPVEVGDEPVYVGAETFGPRTVRNGSATVRRADAAGPTHVVLRRGGDEGNGSAAGEVLGSRLLSEGTWTNVSVPLDRPADVEANETLRLAVALRRDDGDAELDPGDDPVPVGNATVATSLAVRWPPEEGSSGAGGGGGAGGPPTEGREGRGAPTGAAVLATAGLAGAGLALRRRREAP